MNQSGISAPAAHRPDRQAVRQSAYRDDVRSYDQNTDAFQGYRRAVVEALPVRRGQVVLDVGMRDRAVLRFAPGEGGPAGRCGGH